MAFSWFHNGRITLTSTDTFGETGRWGASNLGSIFKVDIMKYYAWINFSIFVSYDEQIFSGKQSHRNQLNEIPDLSLLKTGTG